MIRSSPEYDTYVIKNETRHRRQLQSATGKKKERRTEASKQYFCYILMKEDLVALREKIGNVLVPLDELANSAASCQRSLTYGKRDRKKAPKRIIVALREVA